MRKREESILFVGKDGDAYAKMALSFCRQNFTEVDSYLGAWGDPLPNKIMDWSGDYIISYLSRWIIPPEILGKARVAAVNFHPAPPDYPGIGCINFALYEEADEYGVTCHHMAANVDTGEIVAVKRFPVFSTDNVASLLSRTYAYQIVLFYEIMAGVWEGKRLPRSSECWTRRPFRRTEFEQLARITPDMPRDEIAKRVRATAFGTWRPRVELEGFVFQLEGGSAFASNGPEPIAHEGAGNV